jgi:7-cyano-7-deazaguanine synthase
MMTHMNETLQNSALRALVIFSGGQDSTTCLALAQREHGKENVECITFSYGQRHALEVEVAQKIAKELGVTDHRVVNIDGYAQLTQSALLNPGIEISPLVNTVNPVTGVQTTTLPNTVVDGRNMMFLLMAAIVAKQRGIHDLYTGVCETDSSGYPDCRDVFIKSCNATLNLAMEYEFRIHTPLMWLNKAQTWALADELGLLDYIEANTLTCYNGIVGKGCGTCPACKLRARGLEAYRGSKVMAVGVSHKATKPQRREKKC